MKSNKSLSTPNFGRGSIWDFMSDMERTFNDLWSEPSMSGPMKFESAFRPPVDLEETDDCFLISMDLPGMDEKDIQINVDNGRLSIRGERIRENKEDSGRYRRFERSSGSFERSFMLPQQIDEGKIQARFENGVLEVLIPKSEVAKPRSVKIEAGKGGLFSRLMGKPSSEKTSGGTSASGEDKTH